MQHSSARPQSPPRRIALALALSLAALGAGLSACYARPREETQVVLRPAPRDTVAQPPVAAPAPKDTVAPAPMAPAAVAPAPVPRDTIGPAPIAPAPIAPAPASALLPGGPMRAGGIPVSKDAPEATAPATVANVSAPHPAREFRAAWVSPVASNTGGDWPSRPGLSPEQQQRELLALLDRAHAIGLNAIVLHVRVAGDALYPSAYAPWSAVLTGRSGASPGWDPLAFAVREAHARGLQLHAWFNPFRARLDRLDASAPNHVTVAHPEWIRRYGTQTWIDPGDPAARSAILAAMVDVVHRYDVDGVHIDDYFYPYRESESYRQRVKVGRRWRTVTKKRDIDFPDDRTWRRYGASRFASRAAWRRDNVNDFVRRLYEGVKAEKPWVAVGVSPFGIWRSGVPQGVTGLDAYGEIYADSRLWLERGWMDYVVPQLYWQLGGEQSRFMRLDGWWRTVNPMGRHIWPGLHTAQVMSSARWPSEEIADEIAWVRQARAGTQDSPGHVHFRLKALRAEAGPLGTSLARSLYAEPALVPAFPWLGGRPPAAPKVLAVDESRGSLRVAPGDSVPVAWWLVQARGADGRWTVALRPAEGEEVAVPTAGRTEFVSVTAIDRVGQESGAVVVRW
ncbi:MAG: family 10 glycosylhydrolase [Gemmatimonadaceae bacterium]